MNKPRPLFLEKSLLPKEYQLQTDGSKSFTKLNYLPSEDKAESQGSEHRPRYTSEGRETTPSVTNAEGDATSEWKQAVLRKVKDLCEKNPLSNLPGDAGNAESKKAIDCVQNQIDDINNEYMKWLHTTNMIQLLEKAPGYDKVLYKPLAEIRREDAQERIGDSSLNEDKFATHPQLYPPLIISQYIPGGGEAKSEGDVEKTVGRLLVGVMNGEDLIDKRCVYNIRLAQP